LGFASNLLAFILQVVIWVLFGILFNRTKVDPTYKLIITTTQGEVITLEPKDSDDVKQMQKALEQAIDQSYG